MYTRIQVILPSYSSKQSTRQRMQSLPASYANDWSRTTQLAQIIAPNVLFEVSYDPETQRLVVSKYDVPANVDSFYYFTDIDITPRQAIPLLGWDNYHISEVVTCYGTIINTDNYLDTIFYDTEPVQFTIIPVRQAQEQQVQQPEQEQHVQQQEQGLQETTSDDWPEAPNEHNTVDIIESDPEDHYNNDSDDSEDPIIYTN